MHARRRAWARLTRRQPPHARAMALPEKGRSPLPLVVEWYSGLAATGDGDRAFVGAGLVDRGLGLAIVGLDELVGQQPGFDFFAADVGEHGAVDFHAGAQGLAAFGDHFLALRGVPNDVAILKRQVVFAEGGADPLAPAAGGFQVGDDFWRAHE